MSPSDDFQPATIRIDAKTSNRSTSAYKNTVRTPYQGQGRCLDSISLNYNNSKKVQTGYKPRRLITNLSSRHEQPDYAVSSKASDRGVIGSNLISTRGMIGSGLISKSQSNLHKPRDREINQQISDSFRGGMIEMMANLNGRNSNHQTSPLRQREETVEDCEVPDDDELDVDCDDVVDSEGSDEQRHFPSPVKSSDGFNLITHSS